MPPRYYGYGSDLGDINAMGQGFLQGSQAGMSMGTKFMGLLRAEDEKKAKREQEANAQRLKVRELEMKYPEWAGVDLLGNEAPAVPRDLADAAAMPSPTPSPATNFDERARQIGDADQAVTRAMATKNWDALEQAMRTNPIVSRRFWAPRHEQSRAAFFKRVDAQRESREAAEQQAAFQADVGRRVAAGQDQGMAEREAIGSYPAYGKAIGVRFSDIRTPELTPGQRVQNDPERRRQLAAAVKAGELDALDSPVGGLADIAAATSLSPKQLGSAVEIAGAPPGEALLGRRLPGPRLAPRRGVDILREAAEARETPAQRDFRAAQTERALRPPVPKVPSTPAQMAAAELERQGVTPKTAGYDQRLRERTNAIIAEQANARAGARPPSAGARVTYMDPASGQARLGRIGPDGNIVPITIEGQPASPPPRVGDRVTYEDPDSGAPIRGRVGPDGTITPLEVGGQLARAPRTPAERRDDAERVGRINRHVTDPVAGHTLDDAVKEVDRLKKARPSARDADVITAMREKGWNTAGLVERLQARRSEGRRPPGPAAPVPPTTIPPGPATGKPEGLVPFIDRKARETFGIPRRLPPGRPVPSPAGPASSAPSQPAIPAPSSGQAPSAAVVMPGGAGGAAAATPPPSQGQPSPAAPPSVARPATRAELVRAKQQSGGDKQRYEELLRSWGIDPMLPVTQ